MYHYTGIETDIRLAPPDTEAINFLKDLQCSYPCFTDVVMVLKVFITQKNLDKPMDGGLGKFMLYLLLACHCQDLERQERQEERAPERRLCVDADANRDTDRHRDRDIEISREQQRSNDSYTSKISAMSTTARMSNGYILYTFFRRYSSLQSLVKPFSFSYVTKSLPRHTRFQDILSHFNAALRTIETNGVQNFTLRNLIDEDLLYAHRSFIFEQITANFLPLEEIHVLVRHVFHSIQEKYCRRTLHPQVDFDSFVRYSPPSILKIERLLLGIGMHQLRGFSVPNVKFKSSSFHSMSSSSHPGHNNQHHYNNYHSKTKHRKGESGSMRGTGNGKFSGSRGSKYHRASAAKYKKGYY